MKYQVYKGRRKRAKICSVCRNNFGNKIRQGRVLFGGNLVHKFFFSFTAFYRFIFVLLMSDAASSMTAALPGTQNMYRTRPGQRVSRTADCQKAAAAKQKKKRF